MMTRLAPLVMSSMLALGTSALAQDDPADIPGTNESGSSMANPVARPGSVAQDPYVAVPAEPAASANPAPEVAAPADPRDGDRATSDEAARNRARIIDESGPASDAEQGVVPYSPVDPDSGKPNDLYSGA